MHDLKFHIKYDALRTLILLQSQSNAGIKYIQVEINKLVYHVQYAFKMHLFNIIIIAVVVVQIYYTGLFLINEVWKSICQAVFN